MKTLTLNNQTKIPAIGLGTWQLSGNNCINVVKKSLELGYRHIDTGELYANEAEVGQAIRESEIPREEIFITTKVWQENLTYDRVLKACEISLLKLGTDYIDLYLMHWPDKYLNMKEILKAFNLLYQQGKIKAFGVSNFTIHHLKDTLSITDELGLPISVNQVEFHPLLYQEELLDFCKEKNIIITAYSPLAQGEIPKQNDLKEIGNKYNKTAGQIALKWLLEKNIVIIPKSKSANHLQENIDLNFQLAEEDIEKIDDLNKNQRFVDPGFGEFDY